MACRLFYFNNQQSTVRGYLAAIKFFHKLYLGWELTTSHYMIAAAGKGIDRYSGGCQEKRTSEVAADVVDLSSRIPYGHEFSGGRRRNVVRSGLVVLLVVPSVRTVRVREWARAPGFLFDARLPAFFSWRRSG